MPKSEANAVNIDTTAAMMSVVAACARLRLTREIVLTCFIEGKIPFGLSGPGRQDRLVAAPNSSNSSIPIRPDTVKFPCAPIPRSTAKSQRSMPSQNPSNTNREPAATPPDGSPARTPPHSPRSPPAATPRPPGPTPAGATQKTVSTTTHSAQVAPQTPSAPAKLQPGPDEAKPTTQIRLSERTEPSTPDQIPTAAASTPVSQDPHTIPTSRQTRTSCPRPPRPQQARRPLPNPQYHPIGCVSYPIKHITAALSSPFAALTGLAIAKR